MTRITYGLYRAGVRDVAVTLAAAAARYMPPTPYAPATGAITRYHREGPDQAELALDRSFRRSSYWGQSGTPQAGWADAIRHCFATYCRMARPDGRPAFAVPFTRDVDYPPDTIGVHIDVVLLDPNGYVPRLVLWDTNDFTMDRARLYAAPAWYAAEAELGTGVCRTWKSGIFVPVLGGWSLRSKLGPRKTKQVVSFIGSRGLRSPAVVADIDLRSKDATAESGGASGHRYSFIPSNDCRPTIDRPSTVISSGRNEELRCHP
jgi:hypothetical protein